MPFLKAAYLSSAQHLSAMQCSTLAWLFYGSSLPVGFCLSAILGYYLSYRSVATFPPPVWVVGVVVVLLLVVFLDGLILVSQCARER